MRKIYQNGDLLGPFKIKFIERDLKQRNKGTFICPYCQKNFSAYISNISTGKTSSCGCHTKQKISESVKKDISNQRFGYLTAIRDIGQQNGHRLWECKCDCGEYIKVPLSNLTSGNTTTCGRTKECDYAYKTSIKKQIPNLFNKKFGKLTVIKYIIKDKKVLWECKCDCGSIVYLEGRALTSWGVSSCGCLKSLGESLINQILTKYNISFEQQKSFPGCKDKGTLYFDFYLPDYNCCIEYDGIQHFYPIEYFGGEKALQETQKRDNIKNKYCRDNNIKIIRFSYKDIISEENILKAIQ